MTAMQKMTFVVLTLFLSLSLSFVPAATPPTSAPAISASEPLRATDLNGVVHALSYQPSIKASALVFLSTQCPISNKYVPELNRLAQTHANDGVKLYAVLSDPTLTRAAAAQYVKE